MVYTHTYFSVLRTIGNNTHINYCQIHIRLVSVMVTCLYILLHIHTTMSRSSGNHAHSCVILLDINLYRSGMALITRAIHEIRKKNPHGPQLTIIEVYFGPVSSLSMVHVHTSHLGKSTLPSFVSRLQVKLLYIILDLFSSFARLSLLFFQSSCVYTISYSFFKIKKFARSITLFVNTFYQLSLFRLK